MGGQLSRYLYFAYWNTQLTFIFSIRYTHRTARNLCFLPKLFLECRIPNFHLRSQCLERRRVLHRSLWAKVSISFDLASNSSLSKSLRFERELEALRRELAESTARSSGSSTPTTISSGPSETDLTSMVSASKQPGPASDISEESPTSLDSTLNLDYKKDS